jgi:hypothetical protein
MPGAMPVLCKSGRFGEPASDALRAGYLRSYAAVTAILQVKLFPLVLTTALCPSEAVATAAESSKAPTFRRRAGRLG